MRHNLMGFIARSKRRRTVRRRVIGAGAIFGVAAIATAWIMIAPLQVRERFVKCLGAADLATASSDAMLVDAEVDDPPGVALGDCVALGEAALLSDVPAEAPMDGSGLHPRPS